jgi:hypothetical protein
VNIKNKIAKLPSIVWVILIPIGLIAFIGSIILTFYLLANVEGFASIVMLLAALGTMKASVSYTKYQTKSESGSSFFLALGICFFALMGVAIDQPGNYLYNKPLEIFFCPENTRLERDVEVSHPLPGRTDMTQNFYCEDKNDNAIEGISVLNVILVRFVEYVIIGYLLIFIVKLYSTFKLRKKL